MTRNVVLGAVILVLGGALAACGEPASTAPDSGGDSFDPSGYLAGRDAAGNAPDQGTPSTDVPSPVDLVVPDLSLLRDLLAVDLTEPDGAAPDVPQPADLTQPDDLPLDIGCPPSGVGCSCGDDTICLAFDDGDLCNGHLVCANGACAADAATVVSCPPGDGFCGTSTCEAATGDCVIAPLVPDQTPCQDGDSCTGGDHCVAGVCVSGGEELCGAACAPATPVQCGGAYGVSTASPQATSVLDSYGCDSGYFSGPEMVHPFTVPTVKQVELTLSGGGLYRLFVLPGGATCDPAACLATTANKLTEIYPAGTQLLLVVDGTQAGTAGLSIQCYDQAPEDCYNRRDDDWDDQTDCDDDDCAGEPACIPVVCPDDICHPTMEDCESCPEDCGPCSVCPDGECTEGYEDCESCRADCGICVVCSDHICVPGYEDCESCPEDCGVCP